MSSLIAQANVIKTPVETYDLCGGPYTSTHNAKKKIFLYLLSQNKLIILAIRKVIHFQTLIIKDGEITLTWDEEIIKTYSSHETTSTTSSSAFTTT